VMGAGGWGEVVELVDLLRAQLHTVGGDVLLDRETRLVPEIGTILSPFASSRARAGRADEVLPADHSSGTCTNASRPPRLVPRSKSEFRSLFSEGSVSQDLTRWNVPCLIYAGEEDEMHENAARAATEIPKCAVRLASWPHSLLS
jgi:hypothetical protein